MNAHSGVVLVCLMCGWWLFVGDWLGGVALGLVELYFSPERAIRWQSAWCCFAKVQPNVIPVSHLHVYKLETHNPNSELFVRLLKASASTHFFIPCFHVRGTGESEQG